MKQNNQNKNTSLQNQSMDEPEKSILVGVSGGPDSMALLDLLIKEKRKADKAENIKNFNDQKQACTDQKWPDLSLLDLKLLRSSKIVVCHVNYQHRDTADRDEKIVEEFCNKHHLQFELLKADSKKVTGNFQAWARDLRYDFFEACARKHQAKHLLIAHQQDDHIETYLMQKQRKSIPSHYGLPFYSNRKSLTLIRPLLLWTKQELEDYCIDHQIPYGIDESNLSDDYLRNRIRHQKIEKLSLNQRQQLLYQIKIENKNLDDLHKRITRIIEEKSLFNKENEEIQWLVLDRMISDFCAVHLSKKSLQEALRQLASHGSFEIRLPDRIIQKTLDHQNSLNEDSWITKMDKNEDWSESGLDAKQNQTVPVRIQRILTGRNTRQNQQLKTQKHCKEDPLIVLKLKENVIDHNKNSDHLFEINRNRRNTDQSAGSKIRPLIQNMPIVIHSQKELEDLVSSQKEFVISDQWKIRFQKPENRMESFFVKDPDFPITIEGMKNGDRIDLRYGRKKIARIFVDKKIPKESRADFPILKNKEQKVIFMPQTGADIKHFKENCPYGMVLFSLTNSEQNKVSRTKSEDSDNE